MRAKGTHMVDQPSEADQIRLFIRNLQPTYMQHLKFMASENFTTLGNIGMLVEEDLPRETFTIATNN